MSTLLSAFKNFAFSIILMSLHTMQFSSKFDEKSRFFVEKTHSFVALSKLCKFQCKFFFFLIFNFVSCILNFYCDFFIFHTKILFTQRKIFCSCSNIFLYSHQFWELHNTFPPSIIKTWFNNVRNNIYFLNFLVNNIQLLNLLLKH